MCKDVNVKNTKLKELVSQTQIFQNTKKMLEKHLKTQKLTLKLRKTAVTDQKMVKLVLPHKQIDHVKSSNMEEMHYFFNKIPKSSSQKHENVKSSLPDTC